MSKVYIIHSLDGEPITVKTGVNKLIIEVDGGLKVSKNIPLVLFYDRKQLPKSDHIITPGIFMYIDDITNNVITDGTGRKYEFMEITE